MNVRRFALTCLTFAASLSVSAHATVCDAHYQFDGTLQDASGNGYHGQMIAEGGELSTPEFVAGRRGQALKLSGTLSLIHISAAEQVLRKRRSQRRNPTRDGLNRRSIPRPI